MQKSPPCHTCVKSCTLNTSSRAKSSCNLFHLSKICGESLHSFGTQYWAKGLISSFESSLQTIAMNGFQCLGGLSLFFDDLLLRYKNFDEHSGTQDQI